MSAAPKEPLVLLHGVTMSGRVWSEVTPLLREHHEVFTPTALGHRGGALAKDRPVTITALVDACERWLDEARLERPHLAGNSLGGWMALELARRGRAASVCAISPGGFWDPPDEEISNRPPRAVQLLQQGAAMARRTRHLAPFALQLPQVRQQAFAGVAVNGARVPARLAVQITRDLVGCTVLEDVLSTQETIAPLDPLPCPVRLVWAERDKLFPPKLSGAVARRRLPAAAYVELSGLGHVPMLDDPAAVATEILTSTGVHRH